MSEEIRKEEPEEKMEMEMDLEDLEQVLGGSGDYSPGYLIRLMTRIKQDGNAAMLREMVRTSGKAAAAARCCELYPDQCGPCAAAVSML